MVHYLPAELGQQILALVSGVVRFVAERFGPSDRLETVGFCKTDPGIRDSKNPVYLSMRLFRGCSLGTDGSEKCGLRGVEVLDLSEAATAPASFGA